MPPFRLFLDWSIEKFERNYDSSLHSVVKQIDCAYLYVMCVCVCVCVCVWVSAMSLKHERYVGCLLCDTPSL